MEYRHTFCCTGIGICCHQNSPGVSVQLLKMSFLRDGGRELCQGKARSWWKKSLSLLCRSPEAKWSLAPRWGEGTPPEWSWATAGAGKSLLAQPSSSLSSIPAGSPTPNSNHGCWVSLGRFPVSFVGWPVEFFQWCWNFIGPRMPKNDQYHKVSVPRPFLSSLEKRFRNTQVLGPSGSHLIPRWPGLFFWVVFSGHKPSPLTHFSALSIAHILLG